MGSQAAKALYFTPANLVQGVNGKMMVVGICGSPRKAGNTEFLLNEALAVAKERGFETERLLISEMKVDFCNDCGDCSKGKSCSKEDDMTKILSSLEGADGIIVASPVYFGSVTAQLKAVFDRTIPLTRQGFRLKDKVGCAISVGGVKKRRPGEDTGDCARLDAHTRHDSSWRRCPLRRHCRAACCGRSHRKKDGGGERQ